MDAFTWLGVSPLVIATKQRERTPEVACIASAAETAVWNALAGCMQFANVRIQ